MKGKLYGVSSGRLRPSDRYGSSARRTNYGGINFRSAMEANYAAELDFRIKAKEIVSWEYERKFVIEWNGVWIYDYLIDFRVVYPPTKEHPEGLVEWVEVKGVKNDLWKVKARLMKAIMVERDHERYIVVDNVRNYGN